MRYLVLIFLFAGCAKPIIKTEYKEILTPIKCQVKAPIKPVFDKNNLESAKEILAYYKEVEILFYECIKEQE